jgi:hypothetical protein
LRRAEWAKSASNPPLRRFRRAPDHAGQDQQGNPVLLRDELRQVTGASRSICPARDGRARCQAGRNLYQRLEVCTAQRLHLRFSLLFRSGAPRGFEPQTGMSGICAFRPQQPLSLARRFPTNLGCWLVGSEPNEDRVSQQSVGSPGQIGNLRDQPRLNSMHAGKNERRSEARLAGRRQA